MVETATRTHAINNHASLIWSIADLLRGDYKPHEYGKVILPLVVLRRLDCVLEPTKDRVLARLDALKAANIDNIGPVLEPITGLPDVYNTSRLTLKTILADPAQVAGNLRGWIAAFDPDTRDVIEKFELDAQIGRLDRANVLYQVLARVVQVDLHPDRVSNLEMGYTYEELLRRFSELQNETAGEHFTPREVIRAMVDLLFIEDDEALRKPGVVRTMLDPACGTGGMLSVAQDYLRELNPGARLETYGQELNAETWAIARSDMMLKGQKASNIQLGNSFSEDHFKGETFDYLLANPPFGVEWKKVERVIRDEHDKLGFSGRFGAGLPRIDNGAMLFLQHMIAKLRSPEAGGGRLAIVFNGSPLFNGGAGSGESEIRRWIIENDWLESVVALPDELFYRTPSYTYFWVLTNRKRPERRGKVQLVDARELFVRMRKGLGNKRNYISDEQTGELTRLYGAFEESERVRIVTNGSFGFQRITVDRPLRRPIQSPEESAFAEAWSRLSNKERTSVLAAVGKSAAPDHELASVERATTTKNQSGAETAIVTDRRGNPQADPKLRESENVALPGAVSSFDEDPSERLASADYRDAVDAYMAAEVLPFAPDAWVDHSKTKIGYEIALTRQFFKYVPPRRLEEIDSDINVVLGSLQATLRGLAK
jgi:type I restriction enzyme M protein